MCQTEQSLSQSSLCLSSIFISLPFSLACNQPLCMAENNIAPLKRDHTWEKQPTPAALSCRIQKIKITKNRPASNALLLKSLSQSVQLLLSPISAFPVTLDLFYHTFGCKKYSEGGKKHSNSQHVHTNTCVLSEKKSEYKHTRIRSFTHICMNIRHAVNRIHVEKRAHLVKPWEFKEGTMFSRRAGVH